MKDPHETLVPDLFGELVHSYSRADALADGGLVDVTQIAAEAGFVLPVAVTRAVWEHCIAWTDQDSARKHVPQDQEGRCWDVVWMASRAAKASKGGNRIAFTVFVVPVDGTETQPQPVDLVGVVGPGDTAAPVVTLMFPGED